MLQSPRGDEDKDKAKDKDRQILMDKIKQLEEQLIHPSNIHQKLKEERCKREE